MKDSITAGDARHVGRVGALAVALGIGLGVGSGVVVTAPTAWADPDTSGTGTSQSDSTSGPSDSAGTETAGDESTTGPSDPEPDPSTTAPGTAGPDTSLEDAAEVAAAGPAPARTIAPKKKPRTAITARSGARTAAAPAASRTTRPDDAAQPAAMIQRAPTPEPSDTTAAPVVTASTSASALSTAVPQAVPKPTLPTPAKVVNTLLSALTAPFHGSRPGAPVEFPGLWVMLAAARRQLDPTPAVTAASAPAAMAIAATAAATPANAQPIIGEPVLGEPDPTTGAVTGRVVATDPEGAKLTYALLTRPAEGTLTFTSAGAFTYTPTAAQRIRAWLGPVPDAVFTLTVSDGKTAKVTTAVAIPISPTPIHLLNPVALGNPTAVAATNNRAYVVDSSTGTVTVVNTLDGTVLTTIPVGSNPISVGLDHD
ncbi:Ig-like domain-containing protein, partial [Mycolicibacterium diernhoferi]|uniref:Ig-like domain-containing protein n=1 Tax=Mycolicibacterium diernhoferi TaxID=1801 RepID=UPI001F39EABA